MNVRKKKYLVNEPLDCLVVFHAHLSALDFHRELKNLILKNGNMFRCYSCFQDQIIFHYCWKLKERFFEDRPVFRIWKVAECWPSCRPTRFPPKVRRSRKSRGSPAENHPFSQGYPLLKIKISSFKNQVFEFNFSNNSHWILNLNFRNI